MLYFNTNVGATLIVPAHERGLNAPMQGCIPSSTVHFIFMSSHVCNARSKRVPAG